MRLFFLPALFILAASSCLAEDSQQAVLSNTLSLLIYVQAAQITTALLSVAAGIWAFQKWRRRDEHFPRINLEADINFFGQRDGQTICELSAIIENKGIVPIKIEDFRFDLRGLSKEDPLAAGDESIRGQLNLHRQLRQGSFIPKHWLYTFIYPGVSTTYNYVTTIPAEINIIRLQVYFTYMARDGDTHHAATVRTVPGS